VLLALIIDLVIGDVPNAVHPLRWMGNILNRIDKKIKRNSRGSTIIKGMMSYFLVLAIFAVITITTTALVREFLGDIAWIIVCAFFFKLTFAVFSFRRHCRPIQNDLDAGDTESAAAKTQMIVSRNTSGMDSGHIASSCTETISENYADSVCSPGIFFGLLGLFGAWMFRCANLMDAMWGYINEKYRDLGFFPAKLDDVLGYMTSRISILFIALAAPLVGGSPRRAISAARKEHDKTPSPNSGWPMAAAAGALSIRMEKTDAYVMGKGELPTVRDISRCYVLVEAAAVLFLITITVPLFVFAGVHIQVYMEDMILRLMRIA